MEFVEIAPDYYLNAEYVVQFRLVYDPNRGGYCWVFTLSSGKNLFSIPFKSEEEAKLWLSKSFKKLTHMEEELKEQHKGYNPAR